jgi:hypothetical protein
VSEPLRSEGWTVHPSFVSLGPTAPVTLIFEDDELVQLAGVYPVTWRTRWDALSNLRLVRLRSGLVIFATFAGVRYAWRRRSLDDVEALRSAILARGGTVSRRRRRVLAFALVGVLVLASLATGLAAWLTRATTKTNELRDARGVNLTIRDVPPTWSVVPTSYLEYLFGTANQVVTSAPTTAPSPHSAFGQAAADFQRCLGVTNARDRIYGRAGQMPDYQVSSPVLSSTAYHGIEVASITQYYATTTMVRRDVTEMSERNFGSCFTQSSAELIIAGTGGVKSDVAHASNWTPVTYAHGWARGGVVEMVLPGVTSPLRLVMVVTSIGHYEVTLGALVASWPNSRPFLAGLVNILKSRMSSSASSAV